MPRTSWHVIFSGVVSTHAPGDIDVLEDVKLTVEGQRGDLLLLRRSDRVAGPPRLLTHLWSLFERVALVEFKSEARPIRRGDASRLLGYVHQYHAPQAPTLRLRQMAAVLVVVERTPTLEQEWADLGLRRVIEAPGYDRIEGALVPFYVVVLRELVQHAPEQEGLLTAVIADMLTQTAKQWLVEHARDVMANMDPSQEGYDAVWERMWANMPREKVAEVLSRMTLEQRLEGLGPEQRLADLDDAHAVLALPIGVLRGLSPAYVDSLPDDVKAEINHRLAQP